MLNYQRVALEVKGIFLVEERFLEMSVASLLLFAIMTCALCLSTSLYLPVASGNFIGDTKGLLLKWGRL
jgi:hypothetical protein